MNNTQLTGALDRVILVLLTWAASKGWITSADVANFAPVILAALAAAWSWWFNRKAKLVAQAGALPGTTVVTTPELAAATPNSPNVVSSTDVTVVNK